MTYPADLLGTVESAYRDHFGVAPSRASVSFVGVEPIEILRFVVPPTTGAAAVTHYLSLGMSRYPMADPMAQVVDDRTAPRAELAISLAGSLDEIWRPLSILAAAPAVEGAVYLVGGRLHLPDPLVPGSRCLGAILSSAPLAPIEVTGLAAIQVLRLLPATATELAWAKVHGSDALLERWVGAGTDLTDLLRDPVTLG
jgi:hypothetical protein